jgi:hypothetical protein
VHGLIFNLERCAKNILLVTFFLVALYRKPKEARQKEGAV